MVTAGCVSAGGGNREVLYAHHRVDSRGVETKHAGLEEGFWGTEAGGRDLIYTVQVERPKSSYRALPIVRDCPSGRS